MNNTVIIYRGSAEGSAEEHRIVTSPLFVLNMQTSSCRQNKLVAPNNLLRSIFSASWILLSTYYRLQLAILALMIPSSLVHLRRRLRQLETILAVARINPCSACRIAYSAYVFRQRWLAWELPRAAQISAAGRVASASAVVLVVVTCLLCIPHRYPYPQRGLPFSAVFSTFSIYIPSADLPSSSSRSCSQAGVDRPVADQGNSYLFFFFFSPHTHIHCFLPFLLLFSPF